MKIKLFIASLLCLPVFVFSQVSLDSSMAPPLNSNFIFFNAGIPNPPFTFSKTGTNNTWDFTSIPPLPGLFDTTFVIAPSSAPFGSNFPTATHCRYDAGPNPFYTMTKIDSAGITFSGAVTAVVPNGTLFALKPNAAIQVTTFPLTYGSSVSGSGYTEVFTKGSSVGQALFDSVHFKITLIGQQDVIAAGQMILPPPYGTMPAILDRTISTRIDSVWVKGLLTFFQWTLAPGYPTTRIDSSFNWYSDISLNSFAHAFYDNTGLVKVNYLKSTTAVGIDDTQVFSAGNIYPNPTSDIINFSLPNVPSIDLDYQVFNVDGKVLLNGKTSRPSINVSGLKEGMYFLRLIDRENVFVKPFVKI